MSETEQDTSHGGYRATGTAVGVLVLIYFVCPFVYIWPFVFIYGRHGSTPPWVERAFDRAFYPVAYLYRHVPAYRALLEQEAGWFGVR